MVSNILYFHPYVGKISSLTGIFQMGWNHQLDNIIHQHVCFGFPRLPHRPMGFWWGKERAEVPVLREGSGCWGWDLFKVPNPAEPISFGEVFFLGGTFWIWKSSKRFKLYFFCSFGWVTLCIVFYISYKLVSFVIPISGENDELVYCISHISYSHFNSRCAIRNVLRFVMANEEVCKVN